MLSVESKSNVLDQFQVILLAGEIQLASGYPSQELLDLTENAIADRVGLLTADFAAKKAPKGKKDCNKGKICKGSCIAKTKTCLGDMNPAQLKAHKAAQAAARKVKAKGGGGGAAAVAATVGNPVVTVAPIVPIVPPAPTPTPTPTPTASESVENPGILPYKKVKKLGSGAYGTVILTDRGTVIKLANGALSTKLKDAQNEFAGLKQFEKLGIGPKAIGIDGKTIEMELIKGKTLFDIQKEGASPEQHQANQMKVSKALLELHKSGWIHGDAHHKNLLIDSNGKAKLIDAGYAEKVPGPFSSESGYSDIVRSLEKHPALPKFEATMKPFVDAYRREEMEAYSLRDKEQRGPNADIALKKLHDKYLSIADQFIK